VLSRRLPAALCAAALALGAPACGGGDDEPAAPDVPADEMLDRAFERLPRSGVASVDLEAVLPGGPAEAVAAQLEGPFETSSGGLPGFDLEGEAQAAGFGVDLRLVATGGDAYVVFFGENYRVGPEGVAELERRTAGVDPRSWFGSARHAGSEELDDTDVYRVDASLRADRVAADFAAAGLGDGVDVSGLQGGTATALIGVDDGVIRGVRVSSEAVGLDVELSDLGEAQSIEPPPGGGFQPIEDLLERIPGV
jgi:hypothetical protein